MKKKELKGIYVQGMGCVSSYWQQVTENCRLKFSWIERCVPGTFNVDVNSGILTEGARSWFDQFLKKVKRKGGESYVDGYAGGYTDGYVYEFARVTRINDLGIMCWIYRGELGANALELLSYSKLSQKLNISHGDEVRLVIEED
ncbi:MAG: hypothetical protein KGI54_06615 [Pseudomonadota bacterium]|nr:hypothetical protein [Pseudomonadota bacterium]